MNILLFNEAAWDDKNSFGNTVSNFFCGQVWQNDQFYNFYARKQLPDNKVHVSYYNISAFDIVKGALRFKIKGQCFSSDDLLDKKDCYSYAHEKEQKKIDKLHKKNNNILYFLYEQIWRSRLWLNRYLKDFISSAHPDVLFAFAISPCILLPLQKYVKKNFNCKIVLLIADDEYGNYDQLPFYRRLYSKRLLCKCLLGADKLYGISSEISELYQSQFGKIVTTLHKGCDLSLSPKGFFNSPLRFVYAGNLFWGRSDVLVLIAKAIQKINKNGQKAFLEIYTGSTITDEIRSGLNIPGCSKIMGVFPYDEVKMRMHNADIVIHVESFESKSKEKVRYSFSTKIIDCLQSGAQVLGVGPEGIASIEYLRKIDGALVVDSLQKIEGAISNIVSNPELMVDNIKKIRSFALANHEISAVQRSIRSDFVCLLRDTSRSDCDLG